jgi:hypothetical protein
MMAKKGIAGTKYLGSLWGRTLRRMSGENAHK